MELTTEKESKYKNLENLPILQILLDINKEDQSVPAAVERCIPNIEALANVITQKMRDGGRLFYIGAGTSGRLGVLDASEVPPTFGVGKGMVIGIIAGGDTALRNAVENAEDDISQAWEDLQYYQVSDKDVVVGIAASGITPYVIGGLRAANAAGCVTGCIVCNNDTPVAREAKLPVIIPVGPEFLTGSTRMKSGTAQKLVLNMLTTSVMIALGKVKGNKMIDMQLTNKKLRNRGVGIIMSETGLSADQAQALLTRHGSIRLALDSLI
jgi:N-acetylmuramic acid 6-phosphate etherase